MAKEYIIGQEYLDSQNQKKTAYFKDAEAVSTTEVQELTDVQKNTARNNIGASSLTDLQIIMSQLVDLRTKDNFITKNLGYKGTVMAHGEAQALQPVTSGDASIAWVVFTYGDENSPSTAMIHQKHGETTTVQTMFFGNRVADRTITFTDSTRTSIESTTAWGTVTSLLGVQATQNNIVLRLMNSHLDGSQGLYMLTLPALTSTASGVITPSQFASLVNGGDYDSNSKSIRLKHDNTVLASIDATAFIKDGMVSNVAIRNGQLVILFNTDAGKEDIRIPLTDIFNPDNYYTKTEINNLIENNDKVYVDDTVAIHSLPEGEIAGEVKEALVAFRANEAGGKSLAVFKHGTNTGIVATVESWGSSFGMWFFYNGKFCRVTADHSDELWEAHWVDLENAVQPDDEDYIELQEKVTELEVNAVRSGVFDLSKYNAVGGVLATYADLSAALTALNALDSKYKYGGMSFKFVQSSDNNYIQARLMASAFTTDITKWQVVDDEPTAGSKNLVTSGGVYAQGVIKNSETNLAFYIGFLWASGGSYSNASDYRISKAYEIDKLDYIEGLVGTAGVATIAFLKYGQPLVLDTFLGAYVSTGTQQNPQTIKKSELTIPEGTRFFALSWDTTKISSPTIHFKSTIKDDVVNLNKETTIVKESKINESFVNAHYWNGTTEKFVSSINSDWRTTDLYNLDYFDKVEAIMPKASSGVTTSNGVVFDKDFLPKRYLYFSGILGTNTIVDICVKKEAEDEKYVMFQSPISGQTDACKLITYHTIDKESFGEPAMSYFLKDEIFTEPRTQAPARLIASKTLNDKSKDEFLVIFCMGNGGTLSNSAITETTAAYFAEHHISYATIMYQGTIYGADNRAWGNNVAYNAIVDFYTYLMEKYPFRRDVILMGGSMGGLTMGQIAYKRPFPIRFCFGIGIAPGLDICWEYSGINFPAVRAAMRAAFGLASDGSEDENFDVVSQGYDWRPMGVIGDETKQKVGYPNFYIYYGTDDVTRSLFGGVENWETLKQWFINAGVKSVTKNLGEVGHAPMSAIDTAISDGVFDEELSFYVEHEE